MRTCAYRSHLKLLDFKSMKAMEVLRLGKSFMDMEEFQCVPLVLGSAFWAVVQICQAPDTEEKAAACSLLPGRILTWLFSWAQLWVFLENMPDPVLLDSLLFGFPFICGTCSAYFVYHGFLVPACSKVNCQGWETSQG